MRLTWPAIAVLSAATLFAGTGGAGPARADGPVEKAPTPESTGAVFTWKSADGLAYEYSIPKSYDPRKGANLVLILHGSNLDRRWGLANHEAGVFRADDIIVSPDGTSSNGHGAFNFYKDAKDLKRLHALQDELKKAFKIRATFLYGHSNGAFFSYYYAGAYPDDVQGIVGQAGNVWAGTGASPKHHHMAIAVMHGTADPVVSYICALNTLGFYRDAKYPTTHLRSLEGWNHWPNQYQTEQELAWCEGMATDDPERLEKAFGCLEQTKNESGFDRDFSALYGVAKRIGGLESAPAALKERAAKSAKAVEDIAKLHADAITASLGKSKGDKVEDAAWVFHLPAFLRDFDGVPGAAALARDWTPRIDKQSQEANKALDEYWRVKEKDGGKGLAAGVAAIRDGFFSCRTADPEFLKQLETWRNDAKLKLGKGEQKAYDDVVPVFTSARKKGIEAYAEINKKL